MKSFICKSAGMLLLLSITAIQAQSQLIREREVIAVAGGSNLLGNTFLQYTIGEPVVSSLFNGHFFFTQGFQQPPELPPLTPGAAPLRDYLLYPNPAVTNVHIRFDLITEAQVIFRLVNTAGQLIYQQAQRYGIGRVQFSVPVTRFAAGIYTVILNVNGKIYYEQLIIQ